MTIRAITLALSCSMFAHSADGPATTPAPILVELFTSEGCSSCPPADLAVQKLESTQPIRGAQLIVLSEHVDYWNHDGWRDPYSSHAFTERQSAYSENFGDKEVFTPEIVIDGNAELSLSNPKQAEQILEKAAAANTVPVRIQSVKIDGNSLKAVIQTGASSEKADVYVALGLNHAESQVLRGENGGRRLTHVAVVQGLKKIGEKQAGKSFTQNLDLKLKADTDPANIRLTAFLQEPGQHRVLGAAVAKAPFQ